MIDRRWLAAKNGVGEGVAFTNRRRGEVDAVRHVADRIDASDRSARVFIDLHRAIRGDLDCRAIQMEARGIWPAAGRKKNFVGIDRRYVVDQNAIASAMRLDRSHLGTTQHADALALKFGSQM